MTLKIEMTVSHKTAILRLIGRLSVEHLEEVWREIEPVEVPVTLDLSELSLVSLEGVRFLNACEDKGIAVANASPYVSAWMLRERETGKLP
jgi:ABC-type transporter Mla MlaB component